MLHPSSIHKSGADWNLSGAIHRSWTSGTTNYKSPFPRSRALTTRDTIKSSFLCKIQVAITHRCSTLPRVPAEQPPWSDRPNPPSATPVPRSPAHTWPRCYLHHPERTIAYTYYDVWSQRLPYVYMYMAIEQEKATMNIL